MGLRRAVLLALIASPVLAAPASSRAQATTCDGGAAEVREVSFTGNESIPSDELAGVIETVPSSAWRRTLRVIGARHCLVPGALVRDVARLMLYYRRRGYPRAAVDTAVAKPDSHSVSVRFAIRENAPIIVDSVHLRGSIDTALRKPLRDAIRLRSGQPFNRYALDTSTAAVLARVRRAGYLTATARASDRIDSTARRGTAWIDVTTGPRLRVGEVNVEARGANDEEARLSPERVRGLTGLERGDVLGTEELSAARLGLDAVGLYDEVRISFDSLPDSPGKEETVNVSVEAIEGLARQVRLKTGYATLDCFRVQLQYEQAAFMRRAGRLELTTNFSKIGIGKPLDFAPSWCSTAAQEDPYSSRLNYYVGGTYSVAAAGRGALGRSVSLYSERRSEYLAYLKTTYLGGSASLSRHFGRDWSGNVTYDLSYSRTEAEPAVLCATFSACVESDREQFTDKLPFGMLSFGATYDNTDGTADPSRGYAIRGQFRIAPQWLGTAKRQQVIGARASATAYVPLSSGMVLASRVQAGLINTLPGADFIPQSERIYVGGATTVRGFRQNEVGPRVYLADSVRLVVAGADTLFWAFPPDSNEWRAIPTGGSVGINANVELRVRPSALKSLVQFVAFLDAGVVRIRDETELTRTPFVITPGVGLRLATIIGPIRLDVATNPYAPPKGPAYRDVTVGSFETAPLYCVSIGNTLPVTGFNKTDAEGRPIPPVQAEGPCPSTFAPSRPRGFFDRLTINFSIGQAF